MKDCDWIIVRDGAQGADAYAVECERCGTKQRFALPMNVEMWVAAMKVFHRQHEGCELKGKDANEPS